MADNYIGRVSIDNVPDNPVLVTQGIRLPNALSAIIEADTSQSSAVHIPDGWRIDELGFSLGWTGKISFQDSIDDGVTWRDMLENGESIAETPVGLCALPLTADMSLRVSKHLVRFQSGVRGDLVAQTTAQTTAQTIDISLVSM